MGRSFWLHGAENGQWIGDNYFGRDDQGLEFDGMYVWDYFDGCAVDF